MRTCFKILAAFSSAAAGAVALTLLIGVTAMMDAQPTAAAMKRGRDCTLCHTQPPQLNARGKAVKAERARRNKR